VTYENTSSWGRAISMLETMGAIQLASWSVLFGSSIGPPSCDHDVGESV
jgi:hypothetical protein